MAAFLDRRYPPGELRIGVWRAAEWHATVHGTGEIEVDYGLAAAPRYVRKSMTSDQVRGLVQLLMETEAWRQEPNVFVSVDVPLAWVMIAMGDQESRIVKPIASLLRADRMSRILAFVEPFARRD